MALSHPGGHDGNIVARTRFPDSTKVTVGIGRLDANYFKVTGSESSFSAQKILANELFPPPHRPETLKDRSQSRAERSARTDSWSLDHSPINHTLNSKINGDQTMTQTSLLQLPKNNSSHDLAFFLRTTGPPEHKTTPPKVENYSRLTAASKHALRLLKLTQRPSTTPGLHYHGNGSRLHDEGVLLSQLQMNQLPSTVKQEISSTGKRYLALQIPQGLPVSQNGQVIGELPTHVSVCFPEHANTADVEEWLTDHNDDHDLDGSMVDGCHIKEHRQAELGTNRLSPLGVLTRAVYQPSIMELGSSSPNTQLHHGRSIHNVEQRPASQPEPKRQSRPAIFSEPYNSTANVEVRHPKPRHFASHPVLADRAPSKVVTKSSSSPELPPRSPLRPLCGDSSVPARNAKGSINGEPRPVSPNPVHTVTASKRGVSKTTVVPQCLGPVTTQQMPSRTSKPPVSAAMAKKDRESRRQRSRKPREKIAHQASIDSILCHSFEHPATARTKPGSTGAKRAVPPHTSGVTFGNNDHDGGESNVETVTVGLFGPAPMQSFATDENDHRPDSPTTPCTRNEQIHRQHESQLQSHEPDMNMKYTKQHSLRPAGKGKSREVKGFAPRPRSAQRTALLVNSRRISSRNSQRMSSSEQSPASNGNTRIAQPSCVLESDADLIGPFSLKFASDPPRKALPPTPSDSSGSTVYRTRSTRPHDTSSDDSSSGYETIATTPGSATRFTKRTPHVASQAQRDPPLCESPHFDARLQALEKQNALLSAALMAVLKTNGALNSPFAPDGPDYDRNHPTNDTRTTERTRRKTSRSKHNVNGSTGSAHALDMYMHSRNISTQ